MRQGQKILEGLQADVGVRAAIKASQANAASRRNNVGQDRVANFKCICAGYGEGERNLRAGVERLEHVGHSPAPAGLRNLIWHRRLPLHGLIGVGKKLGRDSRAASQVLGAGDRRDQRPNIRDNAKFSLIKKALQLRQIRMKRKVAAIAVRQR